MSIALRITVQGALDGATVPTFPGFTNVGESRYEAVVPGDAGVIPLASWLDQANLDVDPEGRHVDDWLLAVVQLQSPGQTASPLALAGPAGDIPVADLAVAPANAIGKQYLPTFYDLRITSNGAGPHELLLVLLPAPSTELAAGGLCCVEVGDVEGTGGGGTVAGAGLTVDYSVNAAAADVLADGNVNLRTGTRVNPAGAFVGGGIGNKSIRGVLGWDQRPLGDLQSIAYTWRNVVGPGGPFFNPPGGPSVTTPYVNLVVDFDPLGAGDIRILVALDDSLAGAITAAIGAYLNPGGLNTLTYQWDNTMDVLIVNAPPDAVPGGVVPNVTVGPSWPENSYSFAALVAANPDAILVDAYPADGGLPAGAVMPAIDIVSGDSGNVTESGKRLTALTVNGASAL